MPKVSQEHLDARRRGIVKAALRCFVRDGVHATTMRDICRAANLSPGAVYRYFASKRALVEAVAAESRTRLLEALERSAAAGPGLAERLRSLLEELARTEAVEPLRIDLMLRAEALRNDAIRGELDGASRRFEEAFAAAAEGRGAGARAGVVLAIFEGLALRRALEPDLDLGPILDELDRLLA